MRLRNRIVKATFWNDPELCRWGRDKRDFYRSLWACAEDSCCLEDDMFGVKMAAWPSPLDKDMTVEQFEAWRDEMLAEAKPGKPAKLVRYEVDGESYLYIPAMAQHERPRNPQAPDLPLPAWVSWVINDSDSRKGSYLHEPCTTLVQPLTGRPRPVLSCPERSGSEPRAREDDAEFVAVCEVVERLTGNPVFPGIVPKVRYLATTHGIERTEAAAKIAVAKGTPNLGSLCAIADRLTADELHPSAPQPVGAVGYAKPGEIASDIERSIAEAEAEIAAKAAS